MAGEQVTTVVMIILGVSLDPAPVDPMLYSGRGDLEPKPAIRKVPAAAVAPVSLELRNQPADPLLRVFRIGETPIPRRVPAMPGGPCSRPAAPSGYFWWPELDLVDTARAA